MNLILVYEIVALLVRSGGHSLIALFSIIKVITILIEILCLSVYGRNIQWSRLSKLMRFTIALFMGIQWKISAGYSKYRVTMLMTAVTGNSSFRFGTFKFGITLLALVATQG